MVGVSPTSSEQKNRIELIKNFTPLLVLLFHQQHKLYSLSYHKIHSHLKVADGGKHPPWRKIKS
jgi:hypothetical protein